MTIKGLTQGLQRLDEEEGFRFEIRSVLWSLAFRDPFTLATP